MPRYVRNDGDVVIILGLDPSLSSTGWGLVRASNTTPVLVLRFEADSDAELQRIKDVFRTQLLRVEPELQLPF